MAATGMQGKEFDFEKFRLRKFVDRLIDMDEVEVREENTPLIHLSSIIENSPKAVLFKSTGPERVEMIAKAAGGRKRLIAAFDSTEEKIYEDFLNRFANPKKSVEIPSDEAPVHAIKITGKDVDLTKLPFHPQHEFDGSCYISSGIDYVIDPATGRSNVGNFVDYKMPLSMDMPPIRTIILETAPDPGGPWGAKGIGEDPIIAIGPAIANAVHDAIGRRFRRFPITPEDVLTALQEPHAAQ